MSQEIDKEQLKMVTPEFRASYCHLFKPSEVKKGSGKLYYSIEMLFPKATTELSVFQKPLLLAAKAKWGAKENWPAKLKMPYRDGDVPKLNLKTKKREVKPEHVGMWVVKASTDAQYSRPHVVGKDPDVPLENEKQFYAGCYARAGVKAHAYEASEDVVGLKFILDGVQFVKDGKPLGGRRPASEMFGVIEGDSGSDEFGSFDEDAGETESTTESFM